MPENISKPFAILHVPHSSRFIPPKVRRSLTLPDEELESELIRMTDHFTDVLFDCEEKLARKIVYPVSRLVADPERFRDDKDESMSEVGMGAVYTKASNGQDLRGPLLKKERGALIEEYYDPHYRKLAEAVGEALMCYGNCLIVDCHSFPSEPLPYEDTSLHRPEICIGKDEFHTLPWLEKLAVTLFEEARFRVAVNQPFSGSLVPPPYYHKDNRVWSVMVELNRSLYIHEESGKEILSFGPFQRKLRAILRTLISRAFDRVQANPL